MDREWDPMPDAAEEDGEQVEPADAAAPSPRQQATHPSEHNSEEIQEVTSVSTATENGAAGPVNAEENEDDDVVLVGEEEAPQDADISETAADATATPDAPAANDAMATDDAAAPVAMRLSDAPSPPTSSGCVAAKSSATEPIVIDDDEESEQQREAGNAAGGSPGALSCMEPDSEIKIASVTTLGSPEQQGGVSLSACAGVTSAVEPDAVEPAQADLNLMITSVTSLQAGATAIIAAEENGLQISSAFSLSADAASFNPGRGSASTNQAVQNGDGGTHPRTDSWISQSASFPRNQKQTGVDSPSPAPSLPKPQGQSSSSSSGSQPPPRTVKVTCANCKKPLKKGQTAYQRKGSTHLFCSTTCLSAFSHKPAPKKNCTMCKKDITTMKGTIVAQVDSSESFQEFCSTGCLGAYEHPPKSSLKTKCTVCGKLTEIRHEVSFKTVTHKICSDACFNTYRMANGLIMNCCEQCGDYLPTRAAANHSLLVDGQHKRFCCQNCIKEFKQVNSKLASCVICKTLIKTGEVLHGVGAGGTVGSYCSSACMNKGKMATTATILKPTCHVCKSNSLPQYQATLPEGSVLNFCSSQCVTKFQNSTFQTATNGQTPLATTNNVQLKCNYCRGAFRLKPEVLEWEDKVYQFCSKSCCEDYKKLHCIVTFCEYCQEEKTLHETVNFSGVKKPFCSEGCKLLFKQDFIRRLGLKCVSCNHCSQLCKRAVTRQLGGMTRDFCGESCAKKFHDWYYKAARCDCCKVQGSLTESVQWRMEMKHFCDQECLLRFYCQQNEPIMVTQKGPENTSLGFQVQGAKLGLLNQYAGGGMMRDVKNKAVLCKPLTLTKATYCKPHMQSKMLQTDVDDGVKREYVPVPIPVPVFIPVPMNMYTQATPTPISLPIPVPVPVFLPTTLQGAEQIIKTISELKTEVSADPPPTDLLCTEGLTPDDQKPEIKTVTVTVKEHGAGESSSSPSSRGSEEEEGEEEEKYEPELDLESDFPQAPDPVPSLEGLEDNMDFTLPPVLVEEKQEPVPQSQPNGQGNKRRAVEGVACSPRSADGHREERRLPLKARYGVNAWRRWALSSSDQSEDAKETDASKPASGTRSKGNLLSLSPEELSLALGRFVREVSRPNGERYAPDSILYLCLGIQQHLRAKGRKDDLFGDSCYQQFGEQLNRILKDWKPSVLPDGSLWGRVEEQALWSSGQLGAQSPAALLRSLVYLNTKHLGLRTAEQHLRLSFANVYGPDAVHPVTKETSVCGRVPSPSQEHSVQTGSSNRKRKAEDEDPDDGSGSCGVNNQECCIYELYRTKCPASVLHRLDVFYVQPRPACDPGAAPLWFDSTPLERSVLEGLLTRALLVRDVYTTAPAPPQVEEEEAAAQGGGGGDEGE